MSEQPAKRAKLERNLLGSFDRYVIFKEIYKDAFPLNFDDELFKKDSEELEMENTQYGLYLTELENAERKQWEIEMKLREIEMKLREAEMKLREAEMELEMKQREIEQKRLEAKFEEATDKFISKFDYDFSHEKLLTEVCQGLGSLLYDYLDGKLTLEQKTEFVEKVESIVSPKEGFEVFRILMNQLDGFDEIKSKSVIVPLESNGFLVTPSSMTGTTQGLAAKDNRNFIYPYPFGILNHFPVFFCHSVFGKFIDIVKNQGNSSGALAAYNQFMNNNVIASKMDNFLSKLISTVLKREGEFVDEIVAALRELFSDVCDVDVEAESQSQIAVVKILEFPFIIIEAKHTSYSINAVLQGLQYYGITTTGKDFIDNNPCFLFTIDKGFLFIYGVATVNCRIVSTCLVSLEFTNYHLNVNDFMGTLYRCIGALYYFHENFKERIMNDTKDQTHKDYLKHKLLPTKCDQPYPAIFEVDGIGIEFKEVVMSNSVHQAYFKPCVYLVKTADGIDAVLKIASNYDIESHLALQAAHPNLVPRIIAKSILNDQYHIILMEFLGNTHDTLFNVMVAFGERIDKDRLSKSLEEILSKLEGLHIVHGDFRACNIMVKKPHLQVQAQVQAQDPTPNQTETPNIILEDFKLIDFEFSGSIGQPYPVLSMKNPAIEWHDGFNSYMPREHAHDLHTFKMMESKGYKN